MSNFSNNQSQIVNQVQTARLAGPVAQIDLLIPAGITAPRAIYDNGAANGIKGAYDYVIGGNPLNFPQSQNPIAFVFTNDAAILTADVSDADSFNDENGHVDKFTIDDAAAPIIRSLPIAIKQKHMEEGFQYIAILFDAAVQAQNFRIDMEVLLSHPNALDVVDLFS